MFVRIDSLKMSENESYETSERPSEVTFKLVFLGNFGVGKTSIFKRFAFGLFDDDFKLEQDRSTVKRIVHGISVHMSINDTAGQERFRTLTSSYYRNADALLVVYDVTDQRSFDEVDSLFYEATRYSSRALKFLIGNKIDRVDERVIQAENGKAKCDGNCYFYECSAKTNENLQNILETIARTLLESRGFGPNSTESEDLLSLQSNKKIVRLVVRKAIHIIRVLGLSCFLAFFRSLRGVLIFESWCCCAS